MRVLLEEYINKPSSGLGEIKFASVVGNASARLFVAPMPTGILGWKDQLIIKAVALIGLDGSIRRSQTDFRLYGT
jgi:hypothetical protein